MVPLEPLLNIMPFCEDEFGETKLKVMGVDDEPPFAVNVPFTTRDPPIGI